MDSLIWPPIFPREEISTGRALLGMIMMIEDLGLIVKTADENYDIHPLVGSRMIFQYGDVLTIQKWQSLANLIQ